MDNGYKNTLDDYKRKGFADRSGYGVRPALLVVDFINGFTDPGSPLGGDLSAQLKVTQELLGRFRQSGLPVVFTTIAYEPGYRDAGLFIKKIPSLAILLKGSHASQVDGRIPPQAGDYVLEKKFASAFFGTDMDFYLKSRSVDTLVMTGCTTSGCIRASAIDSLQYGFHTIVVKDGVGDRAQGPHDANLFDIDAKYGDVVTLADVINYLHALGASSGMSAGAAQDFQRWWQQKPVRD